VLAASRHAVRAEAQALAPEAATDARLRARGVPAYFTN